MQINYDIWGEPETWETPSNVQIDLSGLDGKLPVFDTTFSDVSEGRFSVASAVRLGAMSNQIPIDDTPCPWRIRGNSYWTSLYKVAMVGTGTSNFEYVYDSPVYTETIRSVGAPVALTYGSSPSMSSSASEYIPGMLHPDLIWGRYDGDTKYGADFAPLLNFNYRKICVVPYIQVFDNGYKLVSYSTYVANGGHTRYRYLQGLQPRIYVGGAGHWTAAPTGLRLRLFGARINPFEIDWPSSSPTGAQTEEFYANEDGLLSYGDGIGSYLLGATRFTDGFTIHDQNLIAESAAVSFGRQMDMSYTNNSYRVFYRALPEGWVIAKRPDTGREYISEYDNVNGDYTPEWILEQFACLGLWIYTGADIADFDPEHPDANSYAPLFDRYGTTTGETVNGAAAALTPAGSWTSNVQGQNVYKGEQPPYDPTDYDPTNKTIWGSSVRNASTNVYALGYDPNTFKPVLDEALEYLYSDVLANADLEYSLKNFLSTSPIDTIQSIIIYPIDIVPTVVPAADAPLKYICFGNIQSTVQGRELPFKSNLVDMGYIDIVRKYGDFRDYEPYTTLKLSLPYCGDVKLEASAFMGRRLKIKYGIDWTSGACTAFILADNLCIQTVNGQIGVQIPVTGLQSAQKAQAIESAQLRYRESMQTSVASMTTSTATLAAASLTGGGSVAGAVSSIVGGLTAMDRASDRLDYDLEHIPSPLRTVGGSSSGIACLGEQRPRLIITRPKMLPGYDASVYGRTTGFACCIPTTLGELSGYVQAASADLSGIPCTAAEKAAIMSALKAGIVL